MGSSTTTTTSTTTSRSRTTTRPRTPTAMGCSTSSTTTTSSCSSSAISTDRFGAGVGWGKKQAGEPRRMRFSGLSLAQVVRGLLRDGEVVEDHGVELVLVALGGAAGGDLV